MTKLETFLKYVEDFAPLVLALVPGIPPYVKSFVTTAIQQAETIPNATGQQKLSAAVNIANAGLVAAQAAGVPIDANVEQNALAQGISAVVTAVNGVTKPVVK